MNKKLLSVLMFAVGAAIGSAVTWKVIKTKYEQIADEEIESVREEYADLMKKMKQKLNETATYEGPQDSDEEMNEEEEEDDEYYPDDDERDFTAHEEEMIDYYKISGKYRKSEGETADDENSEEGGTGDEDEVPYINGPYVISPEDFACSPPGYNAQTLDYFSDGILADDWGVKLDIDETIGEENVDRFGEYVDDILYIRNERTEIDYEVTRDPRTYDEVVRMTPNPYYGKYEN